VIPVGLNLLADSRAGRSMLRRPRECIRERGGPGSCRGLLLVYAGCVAAPLPNPISLRVTLATTVCSQNSQTRIPAARTASPALGAGLRSRAAGPLAVTPAQAPAESLTTPLLSTCPTKCPVKSTPGMYQRGRLPPTGVSCSSTKTPSRLEAGSHLPPLARRLRVHERVAARGARAATRPSGAAAPDLAPPLATAPA
jgi:hypothetical protein